MKLEPSERILFERDGNNYSVTFKETVVKQTGSYTVKATNAVGSTSAVANLKVKPKGKVNCDLLNKRYSNVAPNALTGK